MDCNETRRLLAADLDGELDLVRQLEIEQHLRTCAACTAAADALRARHTALRTNLPRFTAPPALADRIRASLRTADGAPSSAPGAPAPVSRAKILFPFWRVTALAASLALALFAGFQWGAVHTRQTALLDEAVANHLRSLAANHLNDVASTDQHTVKPWFAGRLDFSPPVVDLAADGFPLTGGRLDRLDGHPAAALVYRRRQHAINVFVWSAAERPLADRAATSTGINVAGWSESGLNFTAVSEIPAAELARFVELFRHQSR